MAAVATVVESTEYCILVHVAHWNKGSDDNDDDDILGKRHIMTKEDLLSIPLKIRHNE